VCRLWDRQEEGAVSQDTWLVGWSTVREDGTLLAYSSSVQPDDLQRAFPKGYRFFAVTPQGPAWFERADFAKSQVNTMNGPEPLYLLVLHGEKQLQGSPALFLPKVCTAGAPKLRPLPPEPLAPLRKALKVAGKHLSIDIAERFTVVSRAAIGNAATHVVNFYKPPNNGYPESVAFTMKADGTVVDVLLKGETPTHSRAFPYAVDLEGDGVEELVHLHDVWEGEDEIHLVAWRGGKPQSTYVDAVVEPAPPR
jgi:hypothetical protein